MLPFRPRAARTRNEKLSREQARSPVPDLSRFHQLPEDDDYEHRMLMNALAFAVLAVMVFFGVWIADNMTERAKGQDCILLGRTNAVYDKPNPDAARPNPSAGVGFIVQ